MSLDDLDLPLGRTVDYPQALDPQLLRGIARTPLPGRARHGADHWTAYEQSWLNESGRPECGVLQVRVPASSPAFVESKSLKLYLMSFAMTRWLSAEQVRLQVLLDVSRLCGTAVEVCLSSVDAAMPTSATALLGQCIDSATAAVQSPARTEQSPARTEQSRARTEQRTARDVLPSVRAGAARTERLYSNLLRSLCPVTGQPDYATLVVDDTGSPIDQLRLLTYLVGFRNAACFHEQLIEQIYVDLMAGCAPTTLCVMGLFCRRGGIDIVPVRSNLPWTGMPPRSVRQ